MTDEPGVMYVPITPEPAPVPGEPVPTPEELIAETQPDDPAVGADGTGMGELP